PFATSYEKALASQGKSPSLDTFTTFLICVARQLRNPYHFAPYHQAERSPFDYYQLGLDFIRDLIDFSRSKVLGENNLKSIQDAISKKENVILLSNHQTEIDPQIISLLIEKSYPELAQEMIFVAGHRVTTDPLAVPLSLGRNLLCIYSKRHVENPPETKAEKLQHNVSVIKKLGELLNEGGKCIYIAPSGGRDRANGLGIASVAPFDPQSVEMFYLLARKSSQPTHFHTLALSTYKLLPPPDQILVAIGENRSTSFSPAHLFFGPKLDMAHLGDCHLLQDKQQQREARTAAAWQQVVDNYQSFSQ
ncbi:MAG: 1-acyl-sn-glycerol-3-phosphate acyltransferase, partial [Verrucomicrobia bacterium]|nr:1-acyl-sn-glycerol-3-phosphate acyltransferase [Verrucomicrobiota bacterium]